MADLNKLAEFFKNTYADKITEAATTVKTLTETATGVFPEQKGFIDTIKGLWNSLMNALGLGDKVIDQTPVTALAANDNKSAPQADATPDEPNHGLNTTAKAPAPKKQQGAAK